MPAVQSYYTVISSEWYPPMYPMGYLGFIQDKC